MGAAVAGTWVRVGTVRSVNPAKRELRIDPERRFERRAQSVRTVRVVARDGAVTVCVVDSVDANPGGLIITLGAGTSRDAVAAMKGAGVEAERQRQRRDAVAPVEMEAADWIGLDVVSVDGTRIGAIRGCVESPAHDILEIKTPDGRALLLPAIERTVESIDLDTRIVTVGDIAPYASADAN